MIKDIEPEILWSLYWGNGYSSRQIGNIFGCSDRTIRNRMIEYGIPRRSLADAGTNKYNIIIEPELLGSLYWGNGYAILHISSIFGCSGETIRNKMKKYGVPRRSASGELTDFTFNAKQKEIFEGLMLGDGSLRWGTNNCNFSNTDIHKAYLIWLQKHLGIKDISRIIPMYKDGFVHEHQLYTRVIPSIRDEYKSWYPDGAGTNENKHYKIFPKDIEITPIKMLFWYIGDGTYHKRNKTATFTNCLVFDDWLSLSKKICKVLNIDDGPSIRKDCKDKNGAQKYKFCLNTTVTRKFFGMVDSLGFDIPECYQYKFGR